MQVMSDKEYLKAMAAHYRQFPVPELAAHADRMAAIAEKLPPEDNADIDNPQTKRSDDVQ